tara:strand:+ start:409 stop:1551 length:1143 start_codon:yes stop_codon:yes gene_type:complete
MRIAYCIGSLHNKGGMEKVLANKVNYFIENLDYEIHIITEDQKGLPICYEFNNNVIFHDMAISKLNKKVTKGFTFVENVFKLRKLYNDLFIKIQPDIVIVCERGYLDFVIPFTKNLIPKIREFHFAKEAVRFHASLMKPLVKKIRHLIRYKVLFKLFNKYDYLVLLTNRDKKNGDYKTNSVVIPNMMSSGFPERRSSLKRHHVISVGSMHDKRKAFDVQIKVWKKIIENHPNWILNIYGDGIERENLQNLINELNLCNNVILHGNSNTIQKHFLESSIFLFTSIAEGLPMVLIEALSYGIPCVAYDCPTGPSDIITNNEDGFVVEQNDSKILVEKLSLLIKNEKLRETMGKKAKQNAKRYNTIVVGKQWSKFFDKIINEN